MKMLAQPKYLKGERRTASEIRTKESNMFKTQGNFNENMDMT